MEKQGEQEHTVSACGNVGEEDRIEASFVPPFFVLGGAGEGRRITKEHFSLLSTLGVKKTSDSSKRGRCAGASNCSMHGPRSGQKQEGAPEQTNETSHKGCFLCQPKESEKGGRREEPQKKNFNVKGGMVTYKRNLRGCGSHHEGDRTRPRTNNQK